MQLLRIFSNESYKGEPGYLKTQRVYELIRTLLFFAICLSLFFAGLIATGTRKNLLTFVAILGCLPACKSAVTTFMFFRFKPCALEKCNKYLDKSGDMIQLFDRAFTSYDQNFFVDHLVIRSATIVGISTHTNFKEAECVEHLKKYLSAENIRDVSIKIFTDEAKYLNRLEGLSELSEETVDTAIMNVLCQISL